ncbi:unnamed protein product (macronuclear) [Paramecium tetraurelia]|uniref:Uncharacterized protein n=1 Tax=Paramecium tetraurelia TaxID=5888 RepID=A0CY59_PARTE|nr:uncharacterized protein GSPATT00039064001 [Paramecium tetraurelia]CAK75726.1 unnamed protein product [Paramecium tetraurelia]|eukprot:XP_001443123.1 hypothetical protein (macronuclear) [Paramecium tetraurelia strain d4-2]
MAQIFLLASQRDCYMPVLAKPKTKLLQVIQKLKMKAELILIIYIFLIQITKQGCLSQIKVQELLLKRNHKSVLQQQAGALISQARHNFFWGGNLGSCLKDDAYTIIAKELPYTGCHINQNISISLMQKYLLNTFKIWLWDLGYLWGEDIRFYTIIVYAVLNGVQTKIYDSKLATSIVKITFPDQFVERFDVLDAGGNTYNTDLHILKTDAYYKF